MKPRADVTRSPKHEYQRSHEKIPVLQIFLEKKRKKRLGDEYKTVDRVPDLDAVRRTLHSVRYTLNIYISCVRHTLVRYHRCL